MTSSAFRQFCDHHPPKGLYLNYVINHGGGVVVVKMIDRNDKQGIVQDNIDDDPHRGVRWFKILGNRDYVI